jgi:hypothetical protein
MNSKKSFIGARQLGRGAARAHTGLVRQLVGYGRLDAPEQAELLSGLYAQEWGWFRNFFCPSMKHIRTEVEGSRKKRVYDRPMTPFEPFERIKACLGAAPKQPERMEKYALFFTPPVSFLIEATRGTVAVVTWSVKKVGMIAPYRVNKNARCLRMCREDDFLIDVVYLGAMTLRRKLK